MALTKVTGQVIKNTTDVTVGVLTVTNTLAVGGTVSIGGTLTYEDVTNVDAVGLITARNGIVVGSGITLSKDGDVFFTGIATGNGSGLTALNASNLGSGTVPTARLGSGTASSSTFLRGDSTFAAVTSTTINSNADNRVITGSGTANTLEGESNLTFDGDDLTINKTGGDSDVIIKTTTSGNPVLKLNASGAGGHDISHDRSSNSLIFNRTGSSERMRIDSSGRVLVGHTGSLSEGTGFQVVNTSDNTAEFFAYAASTSGARLTLTKSRSGTKGTNTVVQSGDKLGELHFRGADGTGYIRGATISAVVDGTPGTNDMPGRLSFSTTEDGANSETERLRIDSSGVTMLGSGAIATPKITGPGGLDVSQYALSICMGGSSGNSGQARADATTKEARLVIPHYTNAEEPVTCIYSYSQNDKNVVNIGGGTGLGNNATEIYFNAASDTTTTGSNLKWEIRGTGDLIGTTPAVIRSNSSSGSLTLFGGATNHGGKIVLTGGNSDSDIEFYAESGTSSPREIAKFNQHGFFKARGDMTSYVSDGNNYHEMQADNPHNVTVNMRHGSSNGYGVIAQFNHGNAGIYAYRVYNYASGSDNMFVRTDGDLENINNSYGSTSDVKLKENIVDAKSQWDDIKALRVRNFNYKADESKTKLLGLVAQEAETVCPSLIKTQSDLGPNNEDLGTETKYLKYSILYMKSIKALQEAQTRIETLEAEVAALKSS